MSLKEKLPGMRAEPGHRIRNIVFGTFYVFLAVSIIGSMADGGETGETTEGDTDAADDEAETQSQAQADEGESSDGEEDSDEAATDGGTTTAESEASDQSQSQGLTPADMERVLESEFGLDVYVMDMGDGTIEVDYYSYAGDDEQQLAEEISAIAGAYSALVDDGYETDEMVINVKAPNGEDVGEFRASADDAQAHADGELSDQEYVERVLDSGEVYD